MKNNSDRFLVWAIAVSLGIHATLALTLRHMQPVEAQTEPAPTHMVFDVRIPPPTPTPVPPPPVRETQPVSAAAAPRVAPPKVARDPGGGPDTVDPQPLATGAAPGGDGSGDVPTETSAPTDPPKPSCSTPDAPASASNVVDAEIPDGADGASGTAQVKVTLAASGAIEAAAIYLSTGNPLLDQAALRAARASSYHPELRDCEAVGGTYLFTVNFTQ